MPRTAPRQGFRSPERERQRRRWDALASPGRQSEPQAAQNANFMTRSSTPSGRAPRPRGLILNPFALTASAIALSGLP
jgi:hypothetical protein